MTMPPRSGSVRARSLSDSEKVTVDSGRGRGVFTDAVERLAARDDLRRRRFGRRPDMGAPAENLQTTLPWGVGGKRS
jgi:hypothetical protein